MLPALAAGQVNVVTLLVMLWAAGIVFSRSAFFDLMDIQGDRLVGVETIPILLGEKRSADLLKVNLGAMTILLLLMSMTGLVPSLGFLLLLVPMAMVGVIRAHERGHIPSGARLELMIESNFILAGLLALIWHLFN